MYNQSIFCIEYEKPIGYFTYLFRRRSKVLAPNNIVTYVILNFIKKILYINKLLDRCKNAEIS